MTQQRKREEKSWGCWVINVTLWSISDYPVTGSVTREQIKSDLLLPEMRWEASWAEAGSEGGVAGVCRRPRRGAAVLPFHTSDWSRQAAKSGVFNIQILTVLWHNNANLRVKIGRERKGHRRGNGKMERKIASKA